MGIGISGIKINLGGGLVIRRIVKPLSKSIGSFEVRKYVFSLLLVKG